MREEASPPSGPSSGGAELAGAGRLQAGELPERDWARLRPPRTCHDHAAGGCAEAGAGSAFGEGRALGAHCACGLGCGLVREAQSVKGTQTVNDSARPERATSSHQLLHEPVGSCRGGCVVSRLSCMHVELAVPAGRLHVHTAA